MAINKRGDRYQVDWWTDGRRFRKSFDRQHDARDFAAKVRNEKRLGTHVSADRIPLFREAAETWLAARADRAPASFDQYANHVRVHLIPQFGERRLDQISVEMIAAYRSRLTLAPGTIGSILRTLSSIFDLAVRNGRLVSNPCKRLERAYHRAQDDKRDDSAVREDEILNPQQIRQLIDAAQPGLERTLFSLAAASGARSGELLALRWRDVVFDGRPHIEIRQSLSWAKGPNDVKGHFYFGVPKTKSGRRDIPIDSPLVHILKQWKLQAGRNELDLVFADDGQPIRRPTLLKGAFWPALKRAGLPHVAFHSLRHSFASRLIQHGRPVTEVAHLLGHKDPGITLRVYSHWFKGEESDAISILSAELFAADKK